MQTAVRTITIDGLIYELVPYLAETGNIHHQVVTKGGLQCLWAKAFIAWLQNSAPLKDQDEVFEIAVDCLDGHTKAEAIEAVWLSHPILAWFLAQIDPDFAEKFEQEALISPWPTLEHEPCLN